MDESLLSRLVARLPGKERSAIVLRYGLDGHAPPVVLTETQLRKRAKGHSRGMAYRRTFKEVGAILGISGCTAGQIAHSAIDRMKLDFRLSKLAADARALPA